MQVAACIKDVIRRHANFSDEIHSWSVSWPDGKPVEYIRVKGDK